jgi:AmiR/NasT family two-component response regulator
VGQVLVEQHQPQLVVVAVEQPQSDQTVHPLLVVLVVRGYK